MVLAPPFGHARGGRKGAIPRRPILGTISDLVATPGNNQVVLTWSPPVGGVGYLIQYKLASSGTWIDRDDPTDPPAYYLTPPVVPNLTNDVEYDFRVVVSNGVTTTTSNEDAATPTDATPSPNPLEVTDLAVSDETQSDELTFDFTQVDDGTGNPAKYYGRIRTPTLTTNEWGDPGVEATQVTIDTDLAIGVTKEITFTGLAAGTDYQMLLIPFRGPTGAAEAFGPFTDPAGGTTAGSAGLGTIADLAAAAGDEQVLLTWTPAENATSHQPQVDSGGGFQDFGSPLGAGAGSVTVTGLTNDVSYSFRVVADDGVSTTNSNSVNATPLEGSNNEPPGFSFLRTWNGTSLVPSGWGTANQGPSSHALANDGTQPSGNSNFYRRTYPQGMNPGGAGTEFIFTSNGELGTNEIYFRFYFRFSSNWYGNFPSNVNKICYWGAGDSGQENAMYALGFGRQTNNLEFQVRRQFPSPAGVRIFRWNDGDNAASPTSGQKNFQRGQWQLVEVWQRANTDGNADGALKFWLDGVLIGDFDGFEFFSGDGDFRGWKNDGIYGGAGTIEPPEDMTQDMDDIVIKGKN